MGQWEALVCTGKGFVVTGLYWDGLSSRWSPGKAFGVTGLYWEGISGHWSVLGRDSGALVCTGLYWYRS